MEAMVAVNDILEVICSIIVAIDVKEKTRPISFGHSEKSKTVKTI
jgi:hypothetical protein